MLPLCGRDIEITSIQQRTGDTITINSAAIWHTLPGSTNATRTVLFKRDPNNNRITEIRDPIAGANGLPVVKYIYNEDTGNLIQVLRLVDRSTGSYVTNGYRAARPTVRIATPSTWWAIARRGVPRWALLPRHST